ncbi:MAG: hypothetical protein ACPGE9_11020, partial [Algiphilus sp.]
MRLTLIRPLAVLVALLLAAPLQAQNAVTLNLKDADISALIETVSDVTGRNFIVDPRVKAKINVVSASPMTPDAVYETFLSILQVYGFAAIPAGNATKIVPETNARQDGGSVEEVRGAPDDEIITRVVDIEKDAEGAREYAARGGTGGIPLVAVGAEAVEGWSAEYTRQ